MAPSCEPEDGPKFRPSERQELLEEATPKDGPKFWPSQRQELPEEALPPWLVDDLPDRSWPSRPQPKCAPQAAVAAQLVFAVGGSNGNDDLGTVELLDPHGGVWADGAPLPLPRRELGVAIVEGTLFAVGGSAAGAGVAAVDSWDGSQWLPGPPSWHMPSLE